MGKQIGECMNKFSSSFLIASSMLIGGLQNGALADDVTAQYESRNLTRQCTLTVGKVNDLGIVAGDHIADNDFGIMFDGSSCARAPMFPESGPFFPIEYQPLARYFDLNSVGQAVGYAYRCTGSPEGRDGACKQVPTRVDTFTGTITELVATENNPGGLALGINDRGVAVGHIEQMDTLTPFASLGDTALLLPLDGFQTGMAFDVNNQNQVVGGVGNILSLQYPSGAASYMAFYKPALWQSGALTTLKEATIDGGPLAAALVSTRVVAINDQGIAVGNSVYHESEDWDLLGFKVLRWNTADTAGEPTEMYFGNGEVTAINNCGDAVGAIGSMAAIFRADGSVDTLNIVDGDKIVPARKALSINNRGAIVVMSASEELFLLTPKVASNCQLADLTQDVGFPAPPQVAAAKKGKAAMKKKAKVMKLQKAKKQGRKKAKHSAH